MSKIEHNMNNSLDENIPTLADEHQMLTGQQATEEQVALYMSNLLNDHAQRIHAVTAQRLLTARSLAVEHLASQQAVQGVHQSGNVLQWLGGHVGQYFGRHRVMSAAMLTGVMLLTFFATQQFELNSNLEDSDAFLLASDLPPEAYADKGFDTWLVSKRD